MPRAVILTALPVEYLAVRSHLSNLQEEMHSQGTIYERGRFVANGQEWEVSIVETGAGNAGAAVESERAIAYFKPDILFFVGIAGGIKDVAIGDVVAATKVYCYESGKVGEHFFMRPAVGQSDYALVQRAKSEARNEEWLQRITSNLTTQPRVFVAPIAAGEKVVASKESELFKFLRESYNDAVAVEMEGFGFMSAAFAYPEIKAIIVRGISDLINSKNDCSLETEKIRQERASHHAGAFTFELLAKYESQFAAQIECLSQNGEPQRIKLIAGKKLIAGRGNDMDIIFLHSCVSKSHAEFSFIDEELWIRDNGSKNGTFVNGTNVKEACLKCGDEVRLGTKGPLLKVIDLLASTRTDSE
jgi:nucleoside phosphorylase